METVFIERGDTCRCFHHSSEHTKGRLGGCTVCDCPCIIFHWDGNPNDVKKSIYDNFIKPKDLLEAENQMIRDVAHEMNILLTHKGPCKYCNMCYATELEHEKLCPERNRING